MSESKIGMDGENAPENGSFAAYFIHQNQKKRYKEGYIKFIVSILRMQEKRKVGKALRLDKKPNEEMHSPLTLAGTGQLVMTITAHRDGIPGTRQ